MIRGDDSMTYSPASDKSLRLLGLACRARKALCGFEGVSQAIRQKKAKLLWLAQDSGKDSSEKLCRLACRHNVPVLVAHEKESLGHWTGKNEIAAVAILDDSMARAIQESVAAAK